MAYHPQVITVPQGGTGLITGTTAYAPLCTGTTATGNFQAASTGLSTPGYVLTSTGSSSLPTFQAIPSGSTTPVLFVYLNTPVSNVTGDGTNYTVVYDTVSVDTASGYNSGTGVYTFPATGNYWVAANACCGGASAASVTGEMKILTSSNGNGWTDFIFNPATIADGGIGGRFGITTATIVTATVGDTIQVIIDVYGGTKTVGVGVYGSRPWTNLSIMQIPTHIS